MINRLIVLILISLLWSCQQQKLPYLGEPEVVTKEVNGEKVEETIYPTIPDFSFTNQEGQTITAKDFNGKVYVADFFFTTCPTICPPMTKNLLKVYNTFKNNPGVALLSHTIDPEHDSVSVLKEYANGLGVKADKWQFVTGNREEIYNLAQKHYLVSAKEDSSEAGGYIHSGHFILIDQNKHIRGMYDGTTDKGTAELLKDIELLLKE